MYKQTEKAVLKSQEKEMFESIDKVLPNKNWVAPLFKKIILILGAKYGRR